ncbi:hypothetical protein ACVPOW_00370 [Staphylococcus aureus]
MTLDDIDLEKYYDDMVANPNVEKKKKNAREMLNLIAQTQLQSGYPSLMFKDNANRVHPNSNIGQIKMSNLCCRKFSNYKKLQLLMTMVLKTKLNVIFLVTWAH